MDKISDVARAITQIGFGSTTLTDTTTLTEALLEIASALNNIAEAIENTKD